MITEEQSHTILKTLEPYKPIKIGVFGSQARSDANEQSDLDLLINVKQPLNLFELIEIEEELSKLLDIEVDLVTEQSVNKHLKPYIDKEIKYILNETQ
ncbi:nucleotidyltransferase [Aliifodinibius salipaludis]|uniref:Nucleotidyltransferase n=1 Tax=Fodinibius salipaludis TaxID=2032627 RepID=A0A2A2G867_9BACT|nr:nucleotidyltransferase domain-containing protein [Aliifodinibius salipaludis]PAU93184.1 nucleotidyltransferase [Aliifodinibius salipaludis]